MTWFTIFLQGSVLIMAAIMISQHIIIILKKRKGIKVNAVIDKMVKTRVGRHQTTRWYVHYEYNDKQYYSFFVDPPLAHYEGDKVEIVLVADNPEEIFAPDYTSDVLVVLAVSIGCIVLLMSIIRNLL